MNGEQLMILNRSLRRLTTCVATSLFMKTTPAMSNTICSWLVWWLAQVSLSSAN